MSEVANPPRGAPRRIVRAHAAQFGVALIVVAFLAAMWLYAPAFLSYRNLINVLVQSSTLGILAIGMAAVLFTGGIDLSMPANMALAAILGGLAIEATGSVALGCAVMIGVSVLVGALNGVAIAYLGMIPFVVTLATMSVAAGTATWLSEGKSISQFPELYYDLFATRVFGIPVPVYVMAVLLVCGSFLLARTALGRQIYAVGTSQRAARIARIPVRRVIFSTYVSAGVAAGIAAVLLTARLGAASASMGADGVVLDIISACVVGGISIYGGSGRLANAVFGAIVITLISNALNLLGASYFIGLVLKGLVIIAFIYLDPRSATR